MVKSTVEKKKVLLVDDHPIVRRGLVQLIERQSDLMVCGEAESVTEAMEAIKRTEPHVAIVDLSLKDSNGLDLIGEIKEHHAQIPVLVLSMHQDSFYVERVLRAGVMGFLTKDEATDILLSAIRKVLGGEFFLSEQMASKVITKLVLDRRKASAFPVDRLSEREMEVFEMLGEGISTRAVAEKLHLSIKTIETHRAKIKEKLRLKNATELLQRAIQWTQIAKKNYPFSQV